MTVNKCKHFTLIKTAKIKDKNITLQLKLFKSHHDYINLDVNYYIVVKFRLF